MSKLACISLAFLATALAAAAPAQARSGGGSSYGDSYYNDMQRNPRYIEPGGDYLPSRYRAYYGRAGYYDRIAADPYRAQYRGRIYVRPYGY